MKKVRANVEGDVVVDEDTRFFGAIRGDLTVTDAATVEIGREVQGTLTVEVDATAYVFGSVSGDVHVRGFLSVDGVVHGVVYRHPGGELFVGRTASLRGGAMDADSA